jgi:hypothetical protein
MRYLAIGAGHAQQMRGFALLGYHIDRVITASGDHEQFARLTEALRDAFVAGRSAEAESRKRPRKGKR